MDTGVFQRVKQLKNSIVIRTTIVLTVLSILFAGGVTLIARNAIDTNAFRDGLRRLPAIQSLAQELNIDIGQFIDLFLEDINVNALNFAPDLFDYTLGLYYADPSSNSSFAKFRLERNIDTGEVRFIPVLDGSTGDLTTFSITLAENFRAAAESSDAKVTFDLIIEPIERSYSLTQKDEVFFSLLGFLSLNYGYDNIDLPISVYESFEIPSELDNFDFSQIPTIQEYISGLSYTVRRINFMPQPYSSAFEVYIYTLPDGQQIIFTVVRQFSDNEIRYIYRLPADENQDFMSILSNITGE